METHSPEFKTCEQHSRSRDIFSRLKSVGLLSKIWPLERVILGLTVCTWMHRELLQHVEGVIIKANNVLYGQDVAKSLLRIREVDVALVNANPRVPGFKLLEGLSSAVSSSFGRRLVQLDFTANYLGESGAMILIDLLEQFSSLRHLALGRNGLGDLGTLHLLSALAENCKALAHLDLHHNIISEPGKAALAGGLLQWTDLTHLNLRACKLGDAIATDCDRLLAGALAKCARLQHLDLSSNPLRAAPESHLASLQGCSALTRLDLQECGLTDAAASQLGDVLQACSALSHLDLSKNEITGHGVSQFAVALRAAPSLAFLDLVENPVLARGLQCLNSGLQL